jgi:DNA-binding response OmpR family regulator
MDGLEVYRRLRELGPVAVVMLAALDTERVHVLELDGNEATKAVQTRELVLRVHPLLLGTGGSPDLAAPGQRTLRAGDIELDVIGHCAVRSGRPLQLTGREFDLLAFFLANPRQAFTRAELLQNVWGWSFGDHSTVTVHVRRLREKIEADPANPRLLATVRSVGYRLDPPAEDPVALQRLRISDGAPPRLPEPEPVLLRQPLGRP